MGLNDPSAVGKLFDLRDVLPDAEGLLMQTSLRASQLSRNARLK